MLMPFGKHKGEPVNQLPLDYLYWLVHNTALREPLSTVVKHAYKVAMGAYDPPVKDSSDVQKAYRRLALKWHPDRGGNTSAMAALNDFMEAIKRCRD